MVSSGIYLVKLAKSFGQRSHLLVTKHFWMCWIITAQMTEQFAWQRGPVEEPSLILEPLNTARDILTCYKKLNLQKFHSGGMPLNCFILLLLKFLH